VGESFCALGLSKVEHEHARAGILVAYVLCTVGTATGMIREISLLEACEWKEIFNIGLTIYHY
jgi:hypothetical protein